MSDQERKRDPWKATRLSRHAMHIALAQDDPPLSPATLRVLLAVLRFTVGYARVDDRVVRSVIAKSAGVSPRTVSRSLGQLAGIGAIVWEPARSGRGDWRDRPLPHLGRIALPETDGCPECGIEPGTDSRPGFGSELGTNSAGTRDNSARNSGQPIGPLPGLTEHVPTADPEDALGKDELRVRVGSLKRGAR